MLGTRQARFSLEVYTGGNMKGMTGTTIGAPIGVRAAGPASPRGLVGRGIEGGRIGSAASAFPSRSLSMFNREAISQSKSSIFNVSRGKEAKPSFARSPSLGRSRNMLDISRPIRSVPVENHSPQKFFKTSEFGVKVKVNKARSKTFNNARSESLIRSRSLIDAAKIPAITQKREVRGSFSRINSSDSRKTVAQRTREVGLNPRVRSERVKSVNPFKDTVILWQNPNISPRVKLESTAKRHSDRERHIPLKPIEKSHVSSRGVEVGSIRRTGEIIRTASKIKTEMQSRNRTEKAKMVKREKIGKRIKIEPTVSPEVRALIYRDIKDAKTKTLPIVMRARGVSYAKAQQEVLAQLVKKHEGKVTVLPSSQPSTKTEIKVLPSVLPLPDQDSETQTQLQPKTETEVGKESEKEKKNEQEELQKIPEQKKIYFEKDERTNSRRVEIILHTFRMKVLYSLQDMLGISGRDLVKDASWELWQYDAKSEVAQSIWVDGSVLEFERQVEKIPVVSSIPVLKKALQAISDGFPAVKLAFKKPKEEVGKKEAEAVYRGPLDLQRAYFGEDPSFGRFRAAAKDDSIWYVTSQTSSSAMIDS